MTADGSYLESVTLGKYTVGSDSTDTITNDTFTIFLNLSTAKINQDVPSGTLTSAQNDFCQALLIAHYIESGSADKKSESIDNYSYSRDSSGSGWYSVYQSLITAAMNGRQRAVYKDSDGATRGDADLGALKFDRNTI